MAHEDFILQVSYAFEDVALALFMNPVTIFLAVLLLAWYHSLYVYQPVLSNGQRLHPVQSMRVWACSILVLNIYYGDSIKFLTTGKPFVLSCFVLGCDAMTHTILHYVWEIRRLRETWNGRKWYVEYRSHTELAHNMYRDPRQPLRSVLSTFIMQFVLFLFYVYHLNKDPDTHDVANVSMVKWFLAILYTDTQGLSEICNMYNPAYWEDLREQAREKRLIREGKTHKIFGGITISFDLDWKIRQALDFAINSAVRTILMLTVPIMLSTENALDFLKDLTAIWFVMTLADIKTDGDEKQDEASNVVLKMVTLEFDGAEAQ